MRRLIPAAITLAALTLTACGATSTTLRPHTAAHTQAAVAAAPATPAAPACDIATWEANSPGTVTVIADMGTLSKALGVNDVPGAAAAGHQLFEDAIAAGTPLPPTCAPKLRQAWHMMMFWYALAGANVYITGFRPGLVNRNYARAGRDVKRGLAQWDIVQAQEQALGG